MCDVMIWQIAEEPKSLNFPWKTVMCDATVLRCHKSRGNHGQITGKSRRSQRW